MIGDYVYRNADDSKRFAVRRWEAGKWNVDTFTRTATSVELRSYAADAGDIFATKRAAVAYCREQGATRAINPENVTDGWGIPDVSNNRPAAP